MTQISYVELPAPALEASKQFFTAAFGWEFIDYGPTYSSAMSGSVEVGLNAEAVAGAKHAPAAENAVGPLVLFDTDDLSGSLASVEAAAGEIISPPYDYPGGRRFHFVDPSGNVLGVYQSDS